MQSSLHMAAFWIAALAFCSIFVTPADARTCGTMQAVQHQKNLRTAAFQKPKAEARATTTLCTADDFYDSVYTRQTEHFQIFYTLNGPHQTTEEFIDTLAKDAEFAWKFHTAEMNLLPPIGTNFTHHYKQEVKGSLYPIEVIDIDMLRDTKLILGGACHGCFGITYPSDEIPEASELLIDNDFLYTPSRGAITDTVSVSGKSCAYPRATEALRNEQHQYSYAEQWSNALRVTTVHELYHAVQLRYLDMYQYWTFWFEASASGVEEIAVPDIDDYFSYLPSMSRAVGTPLDQMIEDYGAGILFVYLYNHVHKNTDKFIWEGFAKKPNSSFQNQLNAFAKQKNISADSLFHDFAVRLSFAGTRSGFLDSTELIGSDEKQWPNFKYVYNSGLSDAPIVKEFSYKFYNNSKLNLENFKGKASSILYKGKEAEIIHLASSNTADSVSTILESNPSIDSVAWILSHFANEDILPTIIVDSTLRAYPTPWRGGSLCFTPLPHSKNFIEIRNRRGDLITREKYSSVTHCIEESRIKELMVPGVYRYRVGSSGKTKDLLIIY